MAEVEIRGVYGLCIKMTSSRMNTFLQRESLGMLIIDKAILIERCLFPPLFPWSLIRYSFPPFLL